MLNQVLSIFVRLWYHAKYRYRTRNKYSQYDKYIINFKHKLKYMEITKNNFKTLRMIKELTYSKGMSVATVELDISLFAEFLEDA